MPIMRRPGNLAGISSPFGDDDDWRRGRSRAPAPPPPPPSKSKGIISQAVEAIAPKTASATVKVAPAVTSSVAVPLTVNAPSPTPVVSAPTPAYVPPVSSNSPVVDPADPNLPFLPNYYVMTPIVSGPIVPVSPSSSETQVTESQNTQEAFESPFSKQGLVGMLVNLWNRVFFE